MYVVNDCAVALASPLLCCWLLHQRYYHDRQSPFPSDLAALSSFVVRAVGFKRCVMTTGGGAEHVPSWM